MSLLPSPAACCQISPTIIASFTETINPNKLFLKSLVFLFHHSKRKVTHAEMGAGVWDVAVKNLTMFFRGHVLCFHTLKLER